MSVKDQPTRKTRSFSFIFLLFMVLLILFIVGFMTITDYTYTKTNFERESLLFQVQTEQNIIEAIRLKDATWSVYDETLNDQMEKGLTSVLIEYNWSHGNPDTMDLTSIKTKLGDNYDIYIIDESGIINKTTYAPELGMDFKGVPYFFTYLTKIRMSGGFFPDRIVRDNLGTGTFRKFAYLPTPDHKYILELGLAGELFEELNQQFDDQASIKKIVSVDPFIENFMIYNSMGRRIDTNSLPEKPVQGYIEEVLKTRKSLDVPRPEQRGITRYLFVDLKTDKYGSDPSRIIEITYSSQLIQDSLNKLIFYHLVIGFAAISLGMILAFVLTRHITRPIKKIVQDVNIIASGDLEHQISSTQSTEFTILENSTNTMVGSLKAALRQVNDGEILQKEMIDQLPVAVFMKNIKDGRYTFWNKASEQIFDRPASDIIGKTDRELFSPEMVLIIEQEDKDACLNHVLISNKRVIHKLRGERIIHMIIVPLCDSTNNLRYILGCGEDLTEEILNLKIDLLFSITRRDILDQLSVIMDHLERAQLKTSPEAMQIFFDKTLESIKAIRNQLAFGRSLQESGITSSKWQPVKKSFFDAVTLLPINNIEISCDIDDIELFADPLLPRFFYILMINSIQHGNHQLTKIRLHTQKAGESLILIYEDNGTGIPNDEKEKIFEFGYEGEGGAALGMFLIREVLGYTGITISERGEQGKNARFEILVPKGKFRYKK